MASQDLDEIALLEASEESNFTNAIKKAQEVVEQFNKVSLDVAVTGETGSGKSSFINAIRGLSPDDEDAAETGVTETTTEPKPYKHPKMPNVTFWDLPGIGTPNFKAKDYLKKVQFSKYDFFIIISSERFRENDIKLAKKIQKKKKHFYFVKSKIDNDVRAEAKNREKTLAVIKNSCLENLKKFKDPKVFLINCDDVSEFDFEELVDTLMSELPEYKQSALIQSVPVTSVSILKKKVKVFEKVTWAAAALFCGIAVVPVPDLSFTCDAAILVTFFTRCYYSFGLDDKSLERLSERVNKPDLKSLIKSDFVLSLAPHSVMIRALSALSGTTVVEYLYSIVPGLGSVVAEGIYFTVTYNLLKKGLKELEEAALMMLREARLE